MLRSILNLARLRSLKKIQELQVMPQFRAVAQGIMFQSGIFWLMYGYAGFEGSGIRARKKETIGVLVHVFG